MRSSSQRRGRIQRTFLPSATIEHSSRSPHINYFYKIKGNVKLLETFDIDSKFKHRSDHSYTVNHFRLSKRLQQLTRTKPPQIQHEEQEKQPPRSRRSSSLKGAVGIKDGVYEMEIANINKTINGTRLGALSSLQIMEDMENQDQLQSSIFHGYENLVKRMDSETAEDHNNTQGKIAPPIALRKKSTAMEGPRGMQRKMEAIYGGEDGFLDKYREYQISLLEKIPSYRSRHLTLDYKNEWRI